MRLKLKTTLLRLPPATMFCLAMMPLIPLMDWRAMTKSVGSAAMTFCRVATVTMPLTVDWAPTICRVARITTYSQRMRWIRSMAERASIRLTFRLRQRASSSTLMSTQPAQRARPVKTAGCSMRHQARLRLPGLFQKKTYLMKWMMLKI